MCSLTTSSKDESLNFSHHPTLHFSLSNTSEMQSFNVHTILRRILHTLCSVLGYSDHECLTNPHVGAQYLLSWLEPEVGKSIDDIPTQWTKIRFDAVDVLFVGPFYVLSKDHNFSLEPNAEGDLWQRFGWVVRAVCTKNPYIRIILLQWLDDGKISIHYLSKVYSDLDTLKSEGDIRDYIDSLTSSSQMVPKKSIATDVGQWLGFETAEWLGGECLRRKWEKRYYSHPWSDSGTVQTFSVIWHNMLSITIDVPQLVNYVNMQNYGVGRSASGQYKQVRRGLGPNNLGLDFSCEKPP